MSEKPRSLPISLRSRSWGPRMRRGSRDRGAAGRARGLSSGVGFSGRSAPASQAQHDRDTDVEHLPVSFPWVRLIPQLQDSNVRRAARPPGYRAESRSGNPGRPLLSQLRRWLAAHRWLPNRCGQLSSINFMGLLTGNACNQAQDGLRQPHNGLGSSALQLAATDPPPAPHSPAQATSASQSPTG